MSIGPMAELVATTFFDSVCYKYNIINQTTGANTQAVENFTKV